MLLSHLAIEVFCSYAQKDERYLRQLETHLSTLNRQGLISLWHNRQILPGADWANAIDEHLETASIILLLISADFIASDYCYGVEMKRALERHKAGEARVIPIVVRPCDWQQLPVALFQPLPVDAHPISEWTSVDEAWTQVVAGLRRVIEDLSHLSVSAPRTDLPSIWMIPYSRNPFFLGRNELLSQIHSQLQAGQATALPQPQAINGLGGIGKTQIAVEFAYRHRHDYQSVLWTLADTSESLISGYIAIAELLNLPQKSEQNPPIVIQAVKTWLQTHGSWLLILDNADDLAMVREFVPAVPGGHLLLTTRAQSMGRFAQRIDVETMNQDVGALFLLRRAGLIAENAPLDTASSADETRVRSICEELGGLPLALDQAGAFIEEAQCSLEDYLSLYRAHQATLLNQRGGLVPDHPEPVATTWSLSFARIERMHPVAADLLRVCSFLQPDAIPEEIFLLGAEYLGPQIQSLAGNELAFNQTINALLAYSLIRRDPARHLLSIHRLVQTVLKNAMDIPTFHLWGERVVQVIEAALPESVYHFSTDDYLRLQLYRPHGWGCILLIEQLHLTSLVAASLLEKCGHLFAYPDNAEPFLQQALHIAEQVLQRRAEVLSLVRLP